MPPYVSRHVGHLPGVPLDTFHREPHRGFFFPYLGFRLGASVSTNLPIHIGPVKPLSRVLQAPPAQRALPCRDEVHLRPDFLSLGIWARVPLECAPTLTAASNPQGRGVGLVRSASCPTMAVSAVVSSHGSLANSSFSTPRPVIYGVRVCTQHQPGLPVGLCRYRVSQYWETGMQRISLSRPSYETLTGRYAEADRFL